MPRSDSFFTCAGGKGAAAAALHPTGPNIDLDLRRLFSDEPAGVSPAAEGMMLTSASAPAGREAKAGRSAPVRRQSGIGGRCAECRHPARPVALHWLHAQL